MWLCKKGEKGKLDPQLRINQAEAKSNQSISQIDF